MNEEIRRVSLKACVVLDLKDNSLIGVQQAFLDKGLRVATPVNQGGEWVIDLTEK